MTMIDDRPFVGETLLYASVEAPIGTALVAAGPNGIAAILIGSDRARLARELDQVLAGATLIEDPAALADMLGAVGTLLAAPAAGSALPLDLRGSPVELAVWRALRALPAGETISYGALARRLDVAATAQEVGAACAANRVAVAVPCHRVVKADGSISGYRWGVARKRQLIALEAAA